MTGLDGAYEMDFDVWGRGASRGTAALRGAASWEEGGRGSL